MGKGKVYLIGAGPGPKDLISLRGHQALQQAEVVIYDYLVDREMLEDVNPQAKLICCDSLGKKQPQEGSFDTFGGVQTPPFRAGKEYAALSINPEPFDKFRVVSEVEPQTPRFSAGCRRIDSQAKVNSAMVKFAKEGKLVARLKNGDPFIFGRAQEEIGALLKNRIEFEVIPGITASQAASCFSGIPLTSRKISSSVIYVSGRQAKGEKPAVDWSSISKNETVVLYMAVKNIRQIAGQLIKNGKPADTPVAAVSQAGRINQKIAIAKLEDIGGAIKKYEITAPAIFIIGQVVRLGKRLNWFGKNKRVLFTGLSAKRFFLRGNYLHLPVIKIEPLDDYADFDSRIQAIRSFDWIVFTSRYAAQYFFQRLGKIGLDARALQNIKISAVGSSTAATLRNLGIIADLIPQVETAKGLLDTFKRIPLEGRKIFLPHSDISDKGLANGLRNFGAKVTGCIAYRNIMPGNLPDLDLDRFDEIIFTSPSCVRNFVKRYGKPPKKTAIRCIGAVTLAQAKKLHL